MSKIMASFVYVIAQTDWELYMGNLMLFSEIPILVYFVRVFFFFFLKLQLLKCSVVHRLLQCVRWHRN